MLAQTRPAPLLCIDANHRGSGIAAGTSPRRTLRGHGRRTPSTAPGGTLDVCVKDISEYGSRFFDKFAILSTNTAILVKVGHVGPIAADVKWRDGHIVGAEFEQPLHPSVLEHIIREMDQSEA